MNKLILVALYFLCYAASAEESVFDEGIGVFSYLGRFLQFPLSVINLDKQSHDTDSTCSKGGDQSSEEVGGKLGFFEHFLLFPVHLIEGGDKEDDSDEGAVSSICNTGSDSYLLEFVIDTVQRTVNKVRTKVLEACSSYDWKSILHDLQTELLHSEYLSYMWSKLKPLICKADTSETARSILSSIQGVFTVTTWTSVRYLIAGIVVLSLLLSVKETDTTKAIYLAKRLLSLHKNSLSSGYRPRLSPIAEHPSAVSVSSMMQSAVYFKLQTLKKAPIVTEQTQREHYPMCEYFDMETCNCGGKSVSRELSPELRHFKMCEVFDLLPCNCGGTNTESVADKEAFANIPVEISEVHVTDTRHCDSTYFKKHCLGTKEQTVRAAPNVPISRDTTPEPSRETFEADDVLTHNERLLQIVERIVDHCLMCKYPKLKHFQSRTESNVNDDEQKELLEEVVTTKKQSVQAEPFVNPDDDPCMTIIAARSTQKDNEQLPHLVHFTVNHRVVCEGSDSKTHNIDSKSKENADNKRNCMSLCLTKDREKYGTTAWKSSDRFDRNTPIENRGEDIAGCSHRISELIKSFETKLNSESPREWDDTIKPLKLNQEFITRLNNLLSAGYNIRYYHANRFTGNPIPYKPIQFRSVSESIQNNSINDKEIVLHELTNYDNKEALDSDHDFVDTIQHEELPQKFTNYDNEEALDIDNDFVDTKQHEELPKELTNGDNEEALDSDNEFVDTIQHENLPKELTNYDNEEALDSDHEFVDTIQHENLPKELTNDDNEEALDSDHEFVDTIQHENLPKELTNYDNKEDLDSNHEFVDTLQHENLVSTKSLQQHTTEDVEFQPNDSDNERDFVGYVDNGKESLVNLLDIEEHQQALLNIDLSEGTKCERPLDVTSEAVHLLIQESQPEYLEDDSYESCLNNTDTDIGSPRHNSTFKDNSPYTTADTVSCSYLRACGDGAIYSTLTRRSPFTEAGLLDLSSDRESARESEGSILDVSGINSSASFYRDAGVLEVAVIFAVHTVCRLTKRFWQKNLTSTTNKAVAVEEKDNGLFIIRQKNNLKSHMSPIGSTHSSALSINSEVEPVHSSCGLQSSENPKGYKIEAARNSIEEYIETGKSFGTWNKRNQSMHQRKHDFAKIRLRKDMKSESLDENDHLGTANNDSNNARFRRKKRDASKERSDTDSSDVEEFNCSGRGPVIYKSRRPSEKYSSTKYDRDETSKRRSAFCHFKRRACSSKKRATQIGSPFYAHEETKRRFKQVNRRRNSIERLSRSSNTKSENLNSRESSSDRSGNFADESSSSSDEYSEIRNAMSEMEINDAPPGRPMVARDTESLDDSLSCNSTALRMQKNRNACTCKTCSSYERQIQDILDQLRSLHCNVWELRDYGHIDKNDDRSKLLAWAWSCIEKQ